MHLQSVKKSFHKDILILKEKGLSNSEIALETNYSISTIEKQIREIKNLYFDLFNEAQKKGRALKKQKKKTKSPNQRKIDTLRKTLDNKGVPRDMEDIIIANINNLQTIKEIKQTEIHIYKEFIEYIKNSGVKGINKDVLKFMMHLGKQIDNKENLFIEYEAKHNLMKMNLQAKKEIEAMKLESLASDEKYEQILEENRRNERIVKA